jgi:hypothetical protein
VAAATHLVSQALAAGNVQAIYFFVAQIDIDALGEFARSPNQRLVFMPLDSSSVMGSIGGITELVQDALKNGTGR